MGVEKMIENLAKVPVRSSKEEASENDAAGPRPGGKQ
jgi:hypothetical protein